MDKINEQIYQANIELVDKNKLLEEDKKILIKRINKALELLDDIIFYNEYITIHSKLIKDTKEILRGRYVIND